MILRIKHLYPENIAEIGEIPWALNGLVMEVYWKVEEFLLNFKIQQKIGGSSVKNLCSIAFFELLRKKEHTKDI